MSVQAGPRRGRPGQTSGSLLEIGAAAEAFTVRSIRQFLGMSRHTIDQLIAGGHVSPARGPRNRWQFSFRDVVLLRVAQRLREERIPTRRIIRSLAALRASLPADLPLTGLRIRAIGDQVVVERQRQAWHPESGQLLIDLELGEGTLQHGHPAALAERSRGRPGAAQPSPPDTGMDAGRAAEIAASAAAERAASAAAETAAAAAVIDEARAIEAYLAAEALEADDHVAAEAAYRRALALDPDLVDAAINLSALLCEAGRAADAEAMLDPVLAAHPEIATLHFNRAVALEDQGRTGEAIDGYRAALRRDASLADAHFNLARLHEQAGDAQRALRHLNAYRRLV